MVTLDGDLAAYQHHDFVKAMRVELQMEEPEMNGDEDLQVVNTKSAGNLKAEVTCPILQGIMTKPVTSKICKHSFDKSSVMELIKQAPSKVLKCPISGCGKSFKASDLEDNSTLERKLKKYKKEQVVLASQRAADDEEMLHV